jgi:hypothetical protein
MPGIFDAHADELFTSYRATLRFRDRIAAGTPSNPKLIEGWLRKNMGVTSDEEIRNLTIQTMIDLGIDPEVFGEDADPNVRFESLQQVSEFIASHANTTVFKRDSSGLYIEARAVKAMLKEATNVVFATKERTKRWGETGKSPRSAAAEWVFVEPDRIHLGVSEPTGIELSIQHVSTPQGPRSSLSYYEYVERAELIFTVLVLEDRVLPEHWPKIWLWAQKGGLGAKRSQGLGQFEITGWDKLNGAKP